MYDTFYDDRTSIMCKHCGAKNTFEDGIQSKMFENLLDEYYVGDVVYSMDSSKCIKDYDWCEKCDEKLPVFFSFNYGIFIGIFETEKEAIYASESFDIIDKYKKLFYKSKKYQKRVNDLEKKIELTIDIHGNEPSSSSFNPFFKFHQQFVDYDIIKTLKNILSNKN